ncbi:MAG: nucleotidyl transferase AbiEii/AbiGii toxin family protein [Clostridia bacterium]|nr:nucleotidyl transferase AbiEii/AbiGii toxin family protein [Clostridia bacterium]
MHWDRIEPRAAGILRDLSSTDLFKEFYPSGGTALSLQLGHRTSVDLDLFTVAPRHKLNSQAVLSRLERRFGRTRVDVSHRANRALREKGSDGGFVRLQFGIVHHAQRTPGLLAPKLEGDLAPEALHFDPVVAGEHRHAGLPGVHPHDRDVLGTAGCGQELDAQRRVMDVLGQVPQRDEGMGLAPSEARAETDGRPAFPRVRQPTEHSLGDLAEGPGRMGVLKELLCILVYGRRFSSNDVAEFCGEDGVVQISFQHLIARSAPLSTAVSHHAHAALGLDLSPRRFTKCRGEADPVDRGALSPLPYVHGSRDPMVRDSRGRSAKQR